MDELIAVMEEIRDLLSEINDKMDNLTSYGTCGLSDVVDAVEGVKGPAGYDLTDIHSNLSSIIDSNLNL